MRYVFCAGVWLCILSGCSDPVVPNTTYPSFIVQEDPRQCSCSMATEYFCKASLGIDPTCGEMEWKSPEKILDVLKNDAIGLGESPIIVRKAEECFYNLFSQNKNGVSQDIPTCVLFHPNGHLYVMLGAVLIDNVVMYQIMHGDSPIWLISQDALMKAGFAEVWQFTENSRATPVHVGNTVLEVSSLYHNFGLTRLHASVEWSLVLTNLGPQELIVAPPVTSCSCTTVGIVDAASLHPGESKELMISLHTSSSVSERQSVFIPVYEEGSGHTKSIEIFIFANKQRSMQVAPSRIDFGEVSAGKKYTRIVNLSEISTDRFSVLEISSNTNNISGTLKTKPNDINGLKKYQVEVLFIPSEELFGLDNVSLTIKTDSVLRPQIELPLTFKLMPSIRAEPNVVSFGSIPINTPVSAVIRVSSDNNDLTGCKFLDIPDGYVVKSIREGNPLELEVVFTPTQKGLIQDKIVVSVQTISHKKSLEIDCAGYVH